MRGVSFKAAARMGAVLFASVEANAQWSVTALHPAAAESFAYDISGTQQIGQTVVFGVTRASLWEGSAASWIDLHPPEASESVAWSTNGFQQAGYAVIGGVNRASLWSGNSGSRVDLHPAPASYSRVYAMSATRQAGFAGLPGGRRASVWRGTSASWVDLHPGGAVESFAYAVSETQEGGSVIIGGAIRASLWSGTPESWISLHPAGATGSEVYEIAGNFQVGVAHFGTMNRASLWQGSATSWIDLNPVGATQSVALAGRGDYQVGWAEVANVRHASIWKGSAATWVDLHEHVPAQYDRTEAYGIWTDGLTLQVVGGAHNVHTDKVEALLWTNTLCTPPAITVNPSATSACLSSPTTFTISTSGTSPNFQWRRNEIDIPNATSPSYTIPSVSPADAGSYDCVITNACGTATSNPATLTVRTPQILTQPSSQTVNVDQPVFFALETDPQSPCAASLQYRWQRRNPLVEDDSAPNAWLDLSDGGGFSGTHTPNLAIFRPTPGLATGYRCTISNACGCEADTNGIIHSNTVNFAAACPSDFNNDGSVDGDDVIGFFERWDSGC